MSHLFRPSQSRKLVAKIKSLARLSIHPMSFKSKIKALSQRVLRRPRYTTTTLQQRSLSDTFSAAYQNLTVDDFGKS
jgi:hypothetical protein